MRQQKKEINNRHQFVEKGIQLTSERFQTEPLSGAHNRVSVCVCLHLLVGELMSAGGAGFLVEVLVWIHLLLGSVLMLVDAGVFGPHAAPHRPAQL